MLSCRTGEGRRGICFSGEPSKPRSPAARNDRQKPISMTNSIAFLFPGQGSQTVGMGKDLADRHPVARQTFEEADEALGYKLSQLCFEGPEEQLRLTEITPPALLTASVAAWRVLREKGLQPAFLAGHSLGEYSAHVAAGMLGFRDAVRAVRSRGKYMQEAVPVGVGAMAAILGMALEEVARVCGDAARGEVCEPANINSPEQIVISGNIKAVERAAQLARDRGAKRAVMLPVSAPFHCSLMQPAQDRLASDLETPSFVRSPVRSSGNRACVCSLRRASSSRSRWVRGKCSAGSCGRSIVPRSLETWETTHPCRRPWSSWPMEGGKSRKRRRNRKPSRRGTD